MMLWVADGVPIYQVPQDALNPNSVRQGPTIDQQLWLTTELHCLGKRDKDSVCV